MVKIQCTECHKEGTLQKIGKRYYRIRHYTGMLNGKPHYAYHQVTEDYAKSSLALKGETIASKKTRSMKNSDLVQKNIDPINVEVDSKLDMEPSAGFGPATITLPR